MFVFAPGDDRRQEHKTDARGEIELPLTKAGAYGFRTRFIEPAAGEHEGRKYQEVRHYATLVLRAGEAP
jgi:hypothetical protein